MKYLLYIAIAAFTLWMVSEIIEIWKGYNAAVYYLTSAYHILAGVGIWGLHLCQSKNKNLPSLLGTFLISITYFALAYFPVQVLNSGLTVSEFIELNPIYKIPGLLSLSGFIIFGIAVLRRNYFPLWTGIILISGTIFYTIAMTLKLQAGINVVNIIISLTIIYMCFFGLRKMSSEHT